MKIGVFINWVYITFGVVSLQQLCAVIHNVAPKHLTME
jgi:hypothetical protein